MISQRTSTTSKLSVAAVLAVSMFLGMADANTIGAFGVYTDAQGGSQGCGATANYNTAMGGSLGSSVSPGNVSISNCATTTLAGTTSPGLTGAFSQTAQSAQSGSGPISSSDYAFANLATGVMRGSATTNAYGALAEMEYWDTLSLTIPGATSSTITDVTLSFSLDGINSGPDNNEVLAQMQVEGSTGCFCTHGNDWAWGLNAGGSGLSTPIGFEDENSSFVTWSLDDNSTTTNTNFTVTGTIALTGANPTLWFATDVRLGPGASFGNTDSLDYTNTGALSLAVPNGVAYSSSSGVFLTQQSGVPEPSSLILLGAGLAAIGLARRKR